MEFPNEVSSALNRYFSTLSHTGYKSYNEVDKLLVLIFMEELLCGPMSEFITEEDYKHIYSSIVCLQGSCMIPYPSGNKGVDDRTVRVPNRCRLKNKS